ncbi:hypothetical protein PV325_000907 [Microctonus aethiopoides]|nr:hypothetical protein PV325_000907 [Microctonus aethiopoides]
MAKNSEINLMIILLGSLCLLIITEAYYEELDVKIKNGDEIIELKWKRTGEYLLNTNVPIWLAKKDAEPILAPRIMSGMGDIITYQDVEKSSAVIYMLKFKVFYGIIDTRFYIERLPFDERLGPNIYHEVGNDYIFSYDEKDKNNDGNQKESDFNDITKLIQDDTNAINPIRNSANEKEDEIEGGNNYQDRFQIHEYYDDILAKLTEDEKNTNNPMTDSVNLDEKEKQAHHDDILSELTQDELNLINSIIDSADIPSTSGLSLDHDNGQDTSAHVSQIESITSPQNMLFAKLVTDTTIMHINIAGFEPETFPYSISKKDLHNPRIHADKTLFKFVKYIGEYKDIFPEDSFDFFFVSSNYAIQKNNQVVPAYSRSSANIFMQRRHNMPYADLLGSIVHITDLRDVIFATRAIAELLTIEYDPSSEESEICGKHNCDIMKKCASFNQMCLKWSKKSQYLFEAFFNSNPIRCFLLNYPRSLRSYDVPAMTIDPKTQCLCFGFSKHIVNEVCPAIIDISACHKKLKCTNKMSRNAWLLPLDGTPCGNNMVCWRKSCLEIVETTTLNPAQSDSATQKRLLENDASETDKTIKKPRKLNAK